MEKRARLVPRFIAALVAALAVTVTLAAAPAAAAPRGPATIEGLPAAQWQWRVQTDVCRPLADAGQNRLAAHCMLERFYPNGSQHACLDYVVSREAPGWNTNATNGRTWGFPQARPGRKMETHGRDWRTSALVQASWMIDYERATYGSPCGAAAHSRSRGWY